MAKKNFESIRFDYSGMMSDTIGEAQGITKNDIVSVEEKAKAAHAYFKAHRGTGMMGWTELMYNQADVVSDIITTASFIRKNTEYFVVLGIGGSALGPLAVFQALCHLHHNELPRRWRGGPKFYVEDNIDPERMSALFDVIKPEKTLFNVITKSGSTSETMSQYLIIMDMLKEKFGDTIDEHVIATTDADSGNLIKLARKENLKTYAIPKGVGGRFSEFCPVGLLPAAVLGINIRELLKGCEYMDKKCRKADLKTNPALMAATLQYISMQRGKNISVMMPYADSLKLMADWYCQLWGESLGKAENNSGEKVYVGQTPVKALGVTDQHSQIQLYTEGPFDKVVTFIGVKKFREHVDIPGGCEDLPGVNFLSGHSLNQLIQVEMFATRHALTNKHRPNNMIVLPEVTPHTIGQLMYFFMLETAYIGAMLDINTFNQPGVEEGKNITYALLGREGYEGLRRSVLGNDSDADLDYALERDMFVSDKYLIK